jgi:hypothetical protein
MAVNDYIRQRFFPHLWCSGCGHGIVLNGMIRAVEKLGMSRNEIVMVSGIGCSSRISGYMDFHTLHTIHGRALAFATGVKLSKPELNVIVPMGDGDALSIGGNHFIHAARRNIAITAIVMNNRIYGMTGGQYSPLTGPGMMATTAPYSNIDQGVRCGGDGQGGRGDVRRPHHDLPRPADGGHHPGGHPSRGLFRSGSDEPVPDLFRSQEQAGQRRGHDEAHAGHDHTDRLEKEGRQSGTDRAGHFCPGREARILQRIQ